MTRAEFLDNINDFYDLAQFCSDEGLSIMEDVYSDDARDEYIDDDLTEIARNYTWREMRDYLQNIPTGSDWWVRDDWGDWCSIDNDFAQWKNDVLEEADDIARSNGWDNWFDTDDEDEEYDEDEQYAIYDEEEHEPDDDEEEEDDDGLPVISMAEFFCASAQTFVDIQNQIEVEEKMEKEAAEQFFVFHF